MTRLVKLKRRRCLPWKNGCGFILMMIFPVCHCLVVMMTVDSSDPGRGRAQPPVCVSPRVRSPATTELSLRRPGQFMVSAPAWPAQTFAAGVQRSGDKKCAGELRCRGRPGEREHSEQAVITGRTTRHPSSQDEKA